MIATKAKYFAACLLLLYRRAAQVQTYGAYGCTSIQH